MTIAKNWFPLLPLQVKVLQMRLIFSSRIMTLMFCRVSLTNTQLIYYPWSHFKTWHNFNFMPFVCIGLSVLYVTMLSLFIFNLRNFKLFLNKKDCKIVFLNLYSKYLRSMIITILKKKDRAYFWSITMNTPKLLSHLFISDLFLITICM